MSDYELMGNIFLGIFMFLGIVVLIALIFAIINAIATWKMFKKAGEEGWKALIPVYSTYTLCQIVGVDPIWILIVVVGGVVSGMFPLLAVVFSIASIYFNILLSISTAKSYGRSEGFGVAMIFFKPICDMILGFGNSKYVGKVPMDDPILKMFKKSDNNNGSNNNSSNNDFATTHMNNTNSEADVTSSDNAEASSNNVDDSSDNNVSLGKYNYCPQCGEKLIKDAHFCGKCGYKI